MRNWKSSEPSPTPTIRPGLSDVSMLRSRLKSADAQDDTPWRSADCDVLVIGGGITGTAASWNLADEGADVLLVDEADLNTKASGRNAGSLHGQIQYPPFAERGRKWGETFAPSLRFLAESVSLWTELDADLGGAFEVVTKGGLLVCDSDDQMRVVEEKVKLEQRLGIESTMLDRDELLRIAPYVSPEIVGAEYCPIEGKGNPLLAAPIFARLATQAGARIETGIRIAHLDIAQDEVISTSDDGRIIRSRVVLCVSGSGLIPLSAQLGIPLPLIEEPVQVSATEPAEHFIDHLVYFAGGKLTLKQASSGTVLIGGGWPADGEHPSGMLTVDPESLRRNLGVALRVVPRLASLALIRAWPGVGIATPDLAPIIGHLGDERVLVGLYPHMGFTAGPLMGRVLSSLALGRSPEIDLGPFDPQRF